MVHPWLAAQGLAPAPPAEPGGTVCTYIEHGNASTTSLLEGGINSGIRTVLRNHRGMTEPHVKWAAKWFFTLHGLPLHRAAPTR